MPFVRLNIQGIVENKRDDHDFNSQYINVEKEYKTLSPAENDKGQGDAMDTQNAWTKIITSLSKEKKEFPTVPKVKKTPVWFSATTDGEIIYIDQALINKPSSKLKVTRKLTYKTFQKVYPFYEKGENGDVVSQEVAAITVDQVYFYSLIHHLCK